MKKLWQVWMVFTFCLAIGLIGMAWLTTRALELDRAEAAARRDVEHARQQTDFRERIAMALWRMDWTLTPLIAQEASRPSFAYRPFLKSPSGKGGKGSRHAVASPLLTQPPNYAVLNFEVSKSNGWTSPQSPAEADTSAAVAVGVPVDALSRNRENLRQLGRSVSFEKLLTLLPDTLLPPISQQAGDGDANAIGTANNYAILNQSGQQQHDGRSDAPGTQQAQAVQPTQAAKTRPRSAASNAPTNRSVPQQMAAKPEEAAGSALGSQSGAPQAQTREQQEWQRRSLGVQNVALSQRSQMMSNSVFMPDSISVREGVSRPVWLGSKLILARRVVSGGDVRIQGCWLAWPEIQERLKEEVADLFSDIELLPVANDEVVPPGRLLATLPVQLFVPDAAKQQRIESNATIANVSAIRVSLVIAWCCLLLGALAVAIMLRSVLALSERRASFVSAVTHELRSPLTTLRMYAEMLAEGMVQQPEQRGRYLTTLRQEADRLSHLVDNVLQYARLERGRQTRKRVKIEIAALMQQATERLTQRASQAGMELCETLTPEDASAVVLTDPVAVEQIVFNLVDNACKYASGAEDRRIHLGWSVGNRVARLRVADHGPGIQAAQGKKLFHPFSKSDQEAAQSAPGVGLGLALSRRLAKEIGGNLLLESTNDAVRGSTFLLELPLA